MTSLQPQSPPGLSSQVRQFLRALASDTRQQVLFLFASGEERTVGEVAELAGIAQSTASQQLTHLREAGLITSRRDGKTVYYRADQATIMATLNDLASFLRSCCAG